MTRSLVKNKKERENVIGVTGPKTTHPNGVKLDEMDEEGVRRIGLGKWIASSEASAEASKATTKAMRNIELAVSATTFGRIFAGVWVVLAALILGAAIIVAAAVISNSRTSTPVSVTIPSTIPPMVTPQPTPMPVDSMLRDLREVASMAPNDVSPLELRRVDRINTNGAHEITVTYEPDRKAWALVRSTDRFAFRVPDGWQIVVPKTFLDGTSRTYNPGEMGEVKREAGFFFAYRLPN